MKTSPAARALDERAKLLEIEADLQRSTLSATLHRWQDRRLLTAGSAIAGLAWKLLAAPKLRWLLVGTALARLRGRDRHA